MKQILSLVAVVSLLFSCNLLPDTKISSTDVGGDTNLTMNATGTKVTTSVVVGSTSYPASATVTSNGRDSGLYQQRWKTIRDC